MVSTRLVVAAPFGGDRDPLETAGVDIFVEVDAAGGMPKTVLVGLPELAVRESVHRVERALVNWPPAIK